MRIIQLNTTHPLLRTELSNLAIPFKGLTVHGQVGPFRQDAFKFLSSVSTTKLPDLLVIYQKGCDMSTTLEQHAQRSALESKGLSTSIPHPGGDGKKLGGGRTVGTSFGKYWMHRVRR